jgi:hypothetical protein
MGKKIKFGASLQWTPIRKSQTGITANNGATCETFHVIKINGAA